MTSGRHRSLSARRRPAGRALLGACGLALLAWSALGQALGGSVERQVKAAYLMNFARYVAFPAAAFADPQAPVIICVLGSDPLGTVLDATVEGKRRGPRPLAVRRAAGPDDLEGCQVVFIAAAEARRQGPWLERLRGRPLLTIGESDAFLAAGGGINLRVVDRRVRFEIDMENVAAAGLRVPSNVLETALRVVGSQRKAAMLINFARYVDWPEAVFADAEQPLTICVGGVDPLGSVLDQAAEGKRLGQRRLAVRRLAEGDPAEGCQVLYLPSADERRLAAALEALRGLPVLTVGEAAPFLPHGGIINLVPDGRRLRFDVDLDNAADAGLHIRSTMLTSARHVVGRRERSTDAENGGPDGGGGDRS